MYYNNYKSYKSRFPWNFCSNNANKIYDPEFEGGKISVNILVNSNCWITKNEWEENGPNIIFKKSKTIEYSK